MLQPSPSPAAGLRGAFWSPERTPTGMKVVPQILQTQDGAAIVKVFEQLAGIKVKDGQ